ncbi:MAG TPA: Uma2 family endonuclease [Urbifossiella sp.]|nr:Uma2 family endonuclease [Urbifossiella sp.]
MSTPAPAAEPLVYPDSDGQPTADNTLQWDWMVKIVGELRELFAGQQVFVAGDLLWYPTEGSLDRQAPDALVAFGRPPGYRGSYKQWEESGVAPQVVFEVLSPSNTLDEMRRKRRWYERHGVEEYYFINPYKNLVHGYVRGELGFEPVDLMDGFVSPRLGIRFEHNGELKLYTPDGREFRTREERVREITEELEGTAEELRKTTLAFEEERERANEIKREADAERLRADEAERRAERLRAKLRAAGIDPDALNGAGG